MQSPSQSNTGNHVPAEVAVMSNQPFTVKPLDWRLVVSPNGTAYKAQTPFCSYLIEFCNCSHGGHWQWMTQFGGQLSSPQPLQPTSDKGAGLGNAMDAVFQHWMTCMLDVLEPVQNPLPMNTEPSLN